MLFQIAFLIAGVYTKNVWGINSNYYGTSAKLTVLKPGCLADTHEEEMAKSVQTAPLSKQGRRYAKDFSYGQYLSPKPTLISHELDDGQTKYTPKEAAVKVSQSGVISNSDGNGWGDGKGPRSKYSYDNHGDLRYHEPIAIPLTLPDGHIADTNEMNATKVAHLEAISKAKSHSVYANGDDNYEGRYKQGVVYNNNLNLNTTYYCRCSGIQGYFTYHGPIPHVQQGRQNANIPEVAAVKAKQYAALSKAKASGYEYSGSLFSTGDSTKEGNSQLPGSVDWKFG